MLIMVLWSRFEQILLSEFSSLAKNIKMLHWKMECAFWDMIIFFFKSMIINTVGQKNIVSWCSAPLVLKVQNTKSSWRNCLIINSCLFLMLSESRGCYVISEWIWFFYLFSLYLLKPFVFFRWRWGCEWWVLTSSFVAVWAPWLVEI